MSFTADKDKSGKKDDSSSFKVLGEKLFHSNISLAHYHQTLNSKYKENSLGALVILQSQGEGYTQLCCAEAAAAANSTLLSVQRPKVRTTEMDSTPGCPSPALTATPPAAFTGNVRSSTTRPPAGV